MERTKRKNLRTVWLTDTEIELVEKIIEERGLTFSDVLRRGIYCETEINELEDRIDNLEFDKGCLEDEITKLEDRIEWLEDELNY